MTHAHDALYIPHNNVRQMSYADDQASDITVKADMYDLHSAISNWRADIVSNIKKKGFYHTASTEGGLSHEQNDCPSLETKEN